MQIPRPEYPRPQLVRDQWLNLNGPWEFEYDPALSGVARGLADADKLAGEILVPYCPESLLSGLGDIDFHAGVWYRRAFEVPADWQHGRVLLHVGACDHDAMVWVNGTLAGTHSGGYTPFTMDITAHLQRGENHLVIHAQDDTRSQWVLSGKQCPDYYSRRCHYTRTTGLWQTVWLEPVADTYVESLRLTPMLESGQLLIEAILRGQPQRGMLRATASLGGEAVAGGETMCEGQHAIVVLKLSDVQSWSTTSPTLYDLDLVLQPIAGSPDILHSYFGMRSVSLSDRAILLNGQPLFQRLVLDQGYYPEGIYTAPDDEALRNDILISQGLGFIGARLHQKLFEPRFLYWADQMGYLVWDEFPNWGLDVSEPRALEVFLPQWLEAVQRDYSHPSLVGWCPFNETQVDQDPGVLRGVYRATKAVDRTRPVIDTSGYQHVETDIYDVHNYDQNPLTFSAAYDALAQGGAPFQNRPDRDAPYQGQPYFVSEYGGIWWNPGQADEVGWGYGGVSGRPTTPDEFIERYRALTEALLDHPRMCALCYTQLYDIEQEVNGLYTYDRQPKFDPEIFYRINVRTAAIEK
ncbi:MAG: glycoside hydrolase family 2 TIM barrel-domain containing protein [Anaerolineae bacterium]